MIDFIQFIGTQRSGSNLLRLMLNQHPEISAHHPPHLLKTFVPLLPEYGSLAEEASRKVLIQDMVKWVEKNPVSWRPIELDQEELLHSSSDIIDIFSGIYTAKMASDNAKVWCCKSTFNVSYVELLEKNYQPFYIYLYRDGRDVAASFKKAIVGPKHIYSIAEKWHNEQKEANRVLSGLPQSRYVEISYEQLIEHPKEVLSTLCEKIGINFDKSMLNYYRSEESLRTAESGEMWKNVTQPVLANNKKKYLQELSQEEIGLFESVASDSLEGLGYVLSGAQNQSLEKSDIDNYQKQDEILRRQAKKEANVHDIQLRQPQEELLKAIKARFDNVGVDG